MSAPDRTVAEWIAECPEAMALHYRCRPYATVKLADLTPPRSRLARRATCSACGQRARHVQDMGAHYAQLRVTGRNSTQ